MAKRYGKNYDRDSRMHACVVKHNERIAVVAKRFGVTPATVRRAMDKIDAFNR